MFLVCLMCFWCVFGVFCVCFWCVFGADFGFRISDFGFRIAVARKSATHSQIAVARKSAAHQPNRGREKIGGPEEQSPAFRN